MVTTTKTTEAPTYHGHRQRLKDRFKTAGADAFPDYEFLELLLFSVIPRRDTKPLAKRLVAAFGGFDGVLSADAERLAAVPGVGPAIISHFKTIQMAAARLADTSTTRKRPLLNSWNALLDYCRAMPIAARGTTLRILFLDNRNRLIVDECCELSASGLAGVSPADVVKRALAHSAAALIMVQQTIVACPFVADVDLAFAKKVIDAAKPLDIDVHDHLLLGSEDHISLRSTGMI